MKKSVFLTCCALCVSMCAWAQDIYYDDDAPMTFETCDAALQEFIPKALSGNLTADNLENVSVTVIETATGTVKGQYQATYYYDDNNRFTWYPENVMYAKIPWVIHRAALLLAIVEKDVSPYAPAESFPLAWENHPLLTEKQIIMEMTLDKAFECYDLTMYQAAMAAYEGDYAEAIVRLRHILAPMLIDDKPENTDENLYDRLAQYGNTNILGTFLELRNEKQSPLFQTYWVSVVANNDKAVPLVFDKNDNSESVCPIDCRENSIECLSLVMREAVTEGLAQKANSEILTVYGLTDTSAYDTDLFTGTMSRYYTFMGFNDATAQTPSYTVCVSIKKNGTCPEALDEVCTVARAILEWIALKGV